MKTAARFLLALLIVVMLLPLAGCEVVTGSGELVSWEMAFADFSRLNISNGFDVEIIKDAAFSITITIDKVLYEYIEINQGGDTVRIGLKGGRTYTGTTQKAVVTLPELKRLELSGTSSANVSGFSNIRNIRFDASGGSNLVLEGYSGNDVEINLSSEARASGSIIVQKAVFTGSGDSQFRITGTAGSITVNGSGGSKFILNELTAISSDIKLTSGSYSSVNVIERINLNLSGNSELDYQGEPRFGSISVSGGSTINQR